MIKHIGKPQKSFIILSVEYSELEEIQVEGRALSKGISIGDIFNYHYDYDASNESNIQYQLISIVLNGSVVVETETNLVYTCKFKLFRTEIQPKTQTQFGHSDVISVKSITNSRNFIAKVLELEPANKYLPINQIDRIPQNCDERLFIGRIIGENILLGQKFDRLWAGEINIKNELSNSETKVVAIYSRSYAEIPELISGLPSLIKLKCDENFRAKEESIFYVGISI